MTNRIQLPGMVSLLGLAGLAALVYGPALWRAELLNFDDNLFFGPDNPQFRAAYEQGRLGGLLDPRQPIANAYLPVAHLSLFFDYATMRAIGVGPRWPHLHSLLLHVVAAFALSRLFGRFGLSRLVATAAGSMFLIHPALAESVAWVSGRKDLLSGLLVFLALNAVVDDVRRPRWWRSCLAGLCAALALYAKGSAVVLAGAAPIAVWLSGPAAATGATGVRRWASAVLVTGIALAAGLHHALLATTEGTLLAAEPGVRLAQVPGAYLHYLGTTLWPVHLNILYPEIKSLESFRDRAGLGLAVLVAILLASVALLRRGNRAAGGGLLLALGALAPFNTAWPASSIAAADRYLYLAVPWFALAGVAVLPTRLAVVAAAILCVPLALLTNDRARVFENSESVWTSSLATDAENAVAAMNLAVEVFDRDRSRARSLVEQAAAQARYAEHALRATIWLRELALQEDHGEEALRHARRACTIAAELRDSAAARLARAHAHLSVATLLHAQGDRAGAQAELAAAAAFAPDHPTVLVYRAEALRRDAVGADGRIAATSSAAVAADALLTRALAADPGNVDALLTRARWLQATGELMRAMLFFRRAGAADRIRPEPYLGLIDLSLQADDFAEAEAVAREALSAGVRDPGVLLRLGLAMTGQGRLDDARVFYESYLNARPRDRAVRRALAAVLAAAAQRQLFQLRPDELEATAARIAELDPDNAKGWLLRGLALRLRRQLEAAIVWLEKARAALPDADDAVRLLAETLRDRGYECLRANDTESALDYFRRCVDVHAAGVDVDSALGILRTHWRRHERAGEAAFALGDAAAAEASFRRCLALVPEQKSACFQLGLAILQQADGRAEEALALFEAAEAGQRVDHLDASMPVLYQVLALQRLGRDDEAVARGRKFLETASVVAPATAERIRAAIAR